MEPDTYECKCAEEVGVVDLLPLLDGRVLDALYGSEDSVVDDQTVQSAEGPDREVRDFGSNLRISVYL